MNTEVDAEGGACILSGMLSDGAGAAAIAATLCEFVLTGSRVGATAAVATAAADGDPAPAADAGVGAVVTVASSLPKFRFVRKTWYKTGILPRSPEASLRGICDCSASLYS